MPPRHSRLLIATVFCVLLLVGVVAFTLLFRRARQAPPHPAELPPIAASTFRNTSASAGFVGMDRCKSCHADAHASYLRTAHSQALAAIDLAAEPPDGEFEDPRSRRQYRIIRQDGRLRHIESIRNQGGERVVLADLPVEMVIGSGRFSRSYLISRDGFLFESPATWYAARPGWGLSPGYDKSNAGFQRPVELRCLTCHAGRVEPVSRSPQRVAIHTQAIDCERCHGPGELHVQLRESPDLKLAGLHGRDETIVNPSRLDRERREDICAQCHLHGAATVELRGRSLQDFRPGQLLSDYAVHYGLEGPRKQMEVVGHVEQMRLSRCYQASPTLTCTTCHDPHAKPTAEEEQAHYREQCLTCHTEQSCREPRETRIKSQPADNCVACHMPRGPTEIPHFAFTHHRIGIHHQNESAPADTEAGLLQPIAEHPGLPELDRQRNLGLAYLQLSDGPGQLDHAETYRAQAFDILTKVHGHHLDDVEVEAGLARLYWGADPQLTLEHAGNVTKASTSSPDAWATACFTLGSSYYNLNQPPQALPWLEQTVQLRPTADVWVMLSDCRQHAGNQDGAVEAARRASEMAPDRPRYLQRYAELLDQTGKSDRAVMLKRRIQDLQYYRQQVDRPSR